MMNRENLHLLINEEIYRIEEKNSENNTPSAPIIKPKVTESIATPTMEEESVPIAIFHESKEKMDLELLHKIISACNLQAGNYKIVDTGFNKALRFKKALVFTPRAKAFYTSIPYQGGAILCSKPLEELAKSKEEKGKLWTALKAYF